MTEKWENNCLVIVSYLSHLIKSITLIIGLDSASCACISHPSAII